MIEGKGQVRHVAPFSFLTQQVDVSSWPRGTALGQELPLPAQAPTWTPDLIPPSSTWLPRPSARSG